MPKTQRKVVHLEGRKMIANVYKFLKEEFEFTKDHARPNMDLSHLSKITKRTAEACGVSLRTVERILKEDRQLLMSGKSIKTEKLEQSSGKPAEEPKPTTPVAVEVEEDNAEERKQCKWFDVPWTATQQANAAANATLKDAKVEMESTEKSYLNI